VTTTTKECAMPTTDTIEIEVCVDCASLIANGDTTGIDDPEREAEVLAQAGIPEGWHVALDCPEDCEGGFSWSPCGACRSPLGGDRHPAVLWEVAA
jgi:hypothetical protein